MTLEVEDGTGKSNADSYVSVADCAAYAVSRGRVFADSPAGPAEAALRNATSYIDSTYRNRFSGSKVHGRAQSLEWPRVGATDAAGAAIPSDEVPVEIINATCEAAVIEQANPGALTPTVTGGGPVKRMKAGSVEIEYGAAGVSGVGSNASYSTVDNALSGLLGSGGGYNLRAVRA